MTQGVALAWRQRAGEVPNHTLRIPVSTLVCRVATKLSTRSGLDIRYFCFLFAADSDFTAYSSWLKLFLTLTLSVLSLVDPCPHHGPTSVHSCDCPHNLGLQSNLCTSGLINGFGQRRSFCFDDLDSGRWSVMRLLSPSS